MGEFWVTQQIFPLFTPMKANCPPAEKRTKEAYGSAQLYGNNSEDKTNTSVCINPSAPAGEK